MRRYPRLERLYGRLGNELAPVSGEIDTEKTERKWKLRARGTPADGVPHHPEQLPQDRE
jgi:hypothetical protein